eukprot:3519818-Amphidinium_carterae.1
MHHLCSAIPPQDALFSKQWMVKRCRVAKRSKAAEHIASRLRASHHCARNSDHQYGQVLRARRLGTAA